MAKKKNKLDKLFGEKPGVPKGNDSDKQKSPQEEKVGQLRSDLAKEAEAEQERKESMTERD